MTARNISLALRNIKQNSFTDFNHSDPLQGNLNVQLNNGAQCNFDGNNLECAFHAKSHNPFQQQVDDPSKDYRFMDKIKIENLILRSIEANRIDFEARENTKIHYTAEYPTYSGVTGSINAKNEGGRSIVRIEGFSGKTKEGFYFADAEKGGTQSIIKVEEDSFSARNKGLGNLGSKFHIESVDQASKKIIDIDSVDQTSKKIDAKDATFDYEGTYQVSYYTEPDATQHDLEISIM